MVGDGQNRRPLLSSEGIRTGTSGVLTAAPGWMVWGGRCGGRNEGFAREWTAKELLARPITVIGDDPAVDVFVVIPFIGLDDLIVTKRTGRLQDAADID